MDNSLLTEELKRRFWLKVQLAGDGQCWLWLGRPSAKGYGRITDNNVTHWAHRVSYLIAYGHLDDQMEIDHLCRNRLCVNPKHLEMVTSDENRRRGHAYIGQSNKMWGDKCRCGDRYCFRTSGKDKKTGEVKTMRYCPTCTREARRRRWIEKGK
ncbi:HNH endonuclease signature motif containing protein [Deinococcus sp.]|uniref:HNH endonuclease signature motif containing protein n=1 Tax=Deinococcus sp. TaxID=47478 RepID=UPI00391BA080